MAVSDPKFLTRAAQGLDLTPEQSSEIWADAIKGSALTQLARNVNLPGNGVKYQTFGDSGAAQWVAEGAEKPVDKPTFGSKLMKPYKLARIIVVSEEFTRDAAAMWSLIQSRASEAIARAIDETFLTGAIDLPGADGIDKLSDAQTVSVGNGKYADFVKIATVVLENNGDFNGMALSPQGISKFLEATDTNGRPLLNLAMDSTDVGSFLGARIVKSPYGYKAGVAKNGDTPAQPAVLGVAGDWNEALYGTVSGIHLKLSDSATVKIDGQQVSLWQNNLIGFLVETEVGFQVRDKSKFAVITE